MVEAKRQRAERFPAASGNGQRKELRRLIGRLPGGRQYVDAPLVQRIIRRAESRDLLVEGRAQLGQCGRVATRSVGAVELFGLDEIGIHQGGKQHAGEELAGKARIIVGRNHRSGRFEFRQVHPVGQRHGLLLALIQRRPRAGIAVPDAIGQPGVMADDCIGDDLSKPGRRKVQYGPGAFAGMRDPVFWRPAALPETEAFAFQDRAESRRRRRLWRPRMPRV